MNYRLDCDVDYELKSQYTSLRGTLKSFSTAEGSMHRVRHRYDPNRTQVHPTQIVIYILIIQNCTGQHFQQRLWFN